MMEPIITQEKKKYNLVQGQFTFNLEIPETVEAKIRHLCNRVHDVEWSGVLFYKTEGSFDDGSFKATCLDICVMDIGTSGFTNFLDTSDIISYRIDHPELLQSGVYEGLIHSHNHMQAFFSSTDINTLLEEGSTLNHFLSLIVNNAGKYVARVTRKLNRKITSESHIIYTESSSYSTYENKEIILSDNKRTEEDTKDEISDTVVQWYDMTINKQEVPQLFNDIDERLDKIRSRKYEVVRGTDARYSPLNTPSYSNSNSNYNLTKTKESVLINTPEKNKIQKEDNRQLTLFNDEKELFGDSSFYITEKVNDTVIKNLCLQLLCGSILINSNSKINIEQWVKKMDNLYEKRFGDLNVKSNVNILKAWIEQFIELLITSHPDEEMEERIITTYDGLDENDCIPIYAYNMAKYLDKLPNSTIKDIMIEDLTTYLI